MSELTALVRDAVAETRRALLPAVEADWSVPAHELEWSCWDTGLHIADDLLFYAMQVIDQTPGGYVPVELRMWDGARPEGMLRSILTCGEILTVVSSSAPSDARGHHTYGVSDPEGFAAMGILETVVHTYDIGLGLGLDWAPPAALCRPVLDRLFPDPPPGDPAEVLLWCTGRAPLGDRPRQQDWRWDGRPPAER